MRSTSDVDSPHRRCGGLCRFTLLMLLTLMPAGLASAQWPGLLPEPVSSADLLGYAERLEFSQAQWPAIEALHDEYKLRYQAYRDGPAADLMQNLMGIQQSQSLDAMRDLIKDMQTMRTTVAQHDRRFFDGLMELLSESQIEARELS